MGFAPLSMKTESARAPFCLAGATLIVLLALAALPIAAGQTASSTNPGTFQFQFGIDERGNDERPSSIRRAQLRPSVKPEQRHGCRFAAGLGRHGDHR